MPLATPRSMSAFRWRIAMNAKSLLIELANISLEIAQMVVSSDDGDTLPAWFVVEASRDIPALTRRKSG